MVVSDTCQYRVEDGGLQPELLRVFTADWPHSGAHYKTCFIVSASCVLGMLAMAVDDPQSLSKLVIHLMLDQTLFSLSRHQRCHQRPAHFFPNFFTSEVVNLTLFLLETYVKSEVVNLTLFLLETYNKSEVVNLTPFF
jgi:hypothetical protein